MCGIPYTPGIRSMYCAGFLCNRLRSGRCLLRTSLREKNVFLRDFALDVRFCGVFSASCLRSPRGVFTVHGLQFRSRSPIDTRNEEVPPTVGTWYIIPVCFGIAGCLTFSLRFRARQHTQNGRFTHQTQSENDDSRF